MDPDQELAKERHRNLTIWKEAMALVNDVYTTTKTFPKDEVWGRLRLRTRPFEKAFTRGLCQEGGPARPVILSINAI